MSHILEEPVREKTNNLCFRPCPTKTGLYKHRRWLEAGNFRFRKKRNCTVHVAKTKTLISFAVTVKLICAFLFAYANCWFSHAKAQNMNLMFILVFLQIYFIYIVRSQYFFFIVIFVSRYIFSVLYITKTCPCNIQRIFSTLKVLI